MRQLGLGRRWRACFMRGLESVVLRSVRAAIVRSRSVAVAVAIAPAAAPAAPAPSFAVVAWLAAFVLLARRNLTLLSGGLAVVWRLVLGLRRELVGLIIDRFVDRDALVRLSVLLIAAVASAAPPPTSAAWAILVLLLRIRLLSRRMLRRRRLVFCVCLVYRGDDVFKVVLVLQRSRDSLHALGDRLRRLDRVHLLAAVDDEGLRRTHGIRPR